MWKGADMTLKEAMQILLDISYGQTRHLMKSDVKEARRIVELYLTPAEPTMEK